MKFIPQKRAKIIDQITLGKLQYQLCQENELCHRHKTCVKSIEGLCAKRAYIYALFTQRPSIVNQSLDSIILKGGSLLFFAGETTYQCLFCHLMQRKPWLKLSQLFQKLSTINCKFISSIFSLYCAWLENSCWVVAQSLGTSWYQL